MLLEGITGATLLPGKVSPITVTQGIEATDAGVVWPMCDGNKHALCVLWARDDKCTMKREVCKT